MNRLETTTHRKPFPSYDPAHLVNPESLARILEAGRTTISSIGCPGWEFLVIHPFEDQARIPSMPWLPEAPEFLAVTHAPDPNAPKPCSGERALTQALENVLEHLILAAYHEGVATCWIADFEPEALRRALGLGAQQEILALTPLAYARSATSSRGFRHHRALKGIARNL
jgi:nitroreductase